jgi:hypothetical protein
MDYLAECLLTIGQLRPLFIRKAKIIKKERLVRNYKGSAITPKHLSQLGHEHMAYSKVPPAGFWPV